MKLTILLLGLTCVLILCSFLPAPKGGNLNCFINFKNPQGLTFLPAQRLPETAEKVRQLQTLNGMAEVSRMDGYRVLYNNKKKAPFVNLKVEVSDPGRYDSDTANILANLTYLNGSSQNMETKELIRLHYNGYTIYGLSRNSIEQGSILGSFVLFPGNGITVFFDFNNLKPEFRNFESLDDYKSQRNQFLGAYTAHIAKCSAQ